MATAIITPRNNGPSDIKGDFTITTQGGRQIQIEKDEVWLCLRGHSNNKPFCDGSHWKVESKSGLDEGARKQ